MIIDSAVAFIAGGAGGFGAATARQLHAAGATVVVGDLDEVKGRAVADDLGERAVFVPTDVLSEASVTAALAKAEEHGPVRIAVVAHGGTGSQRTLDRENKPAGQELFMKVLTVFLGGTYNVVRLAAASIAKGQPLDEGERGVIITTASIAAFEGTIGQAAYSAAKGGVVGMTLPIARDLAPTKARYS